MSCLSGPDFLGSLPARSKQENLYTCTHDGISNGARTESDESPGLTLRLTLLFPDLAPHVQKREFTFRKVCTLSNSIKEGDNRSPTHPRPSCPLELALQPVPESPIQCNQPDSSSFASTRVCPPPRVAVSLYGLFKLRNMGGRGGTGGRCDIGGRGGKGGKGIRLVGD